MKITTILTGVTLLSLVVFGFTFLNLPGTSLLWRALQNSGHAIVFTALTLVTIRSLVRSGKSNSFLSIGVAAIGLTSLGVLIELAQRQTGRGASLSDLGLNTAGIVCGCCLYMLFMTGYRSNRTWITKTTLLAAGCTSMVWSLHRPVVFAVAGSQRPDIPVLANFENTGSKYFVSSNNALHEIAQHSQWTQNRSQSLKVQFLQGRYPSVRLLEPQENWSEFSSLNLRTYNPSNNPVEIRVRIDDKSLGHPDFDHMTLKQLVSTGSSEIKFDLDAFRAAAEKRGGHGVATLTQVVNVIVFIRGNVLPTTLYFDDFALE